MNSIGVDFKLKNVQVLGKKIRMQIVKNKKLHKIFFPYYI